MTSMKTAPVPIPVPRVPSPPISAPPYAKGPAPVMPENPIAAKESFFEDVLDNMPSKVPNWAAEGVFRVCRDLNRHIFKSPAPNPPMPSDPAAYKFAVIGDYGGGMKPLKDVTDNIARDNPNLVLTVGDNVYYHGSEAEYQKKWDPSTAFGAIRTNFPVMPSLGNHDTVVSTEPYFKRFPELDTARYYSFEDHGVHFVALNTNEPLDPQSQQFKWLEQDLAKSKDDWKVLYFHHPMYSGFPIDNGPLKGYLAPLIAKYGVDLVFSGHEHSYQRTKPINSNGTLEIITGGGGQTLHPFISKIESHSAYRDVDFGHVEVEVQKDQLIGRYVVRDGSVRDTFVVKNTTPGDYPGAQGASDAAAAGTAVAGAAVVTPAAS